MGSRIGAAGSARDGHAIPIPLVAIVAIWCGQFDVNWRAFADFNRHRRTDDIGIASNGCFIVDNPFLGDAGRQG
ncbi:hypothetical protein HMF3257_04040 [Spirosoma telluris]|uniref:Uncharacterized protein n=1 Tax=Spirosoma telluris TaxID=2183553 RepID=A0A327NES5_9BACT|nr:hypothetical protein HMF3257_04040 [Spirosoma telluris]